MKRTIAGLIAGLVLGTAVSAGAATQGYWSHRQDGVWCKNSAGTIACIPTTARGYGVGISRTAVMVYDVDRGKSVFQRYQP